MRGTVTWSVALAVVWTQCLWGEGNSWNRIRYSGGTVPAKVNPYDWNTRLTVASDAIVLVLGYRQTVRIRPDQITGLSYGQEAHRRVADLVTLSFFLTPVVLFGLFHKSKEHLIGIEYRTEDGKPAGLLLEAHKGDYRGILHALRIVTGKRVEMSP